MDLPEPVNQVTKTKACFSDAKWRTRCGRPKSSNDGMRRPAGPRVPLVECVAAHPGLVPAEGEVELSAPLEFLSLGVHETGRHEATHCVVRQPFFALDRPQLPVHADHRWRANRQEQIRPLRVPELLQEVIQGGGSRHPISLGCPRAAS